MAPADRSLLASESIWLLAAAFAPLLFNVESARHFEADKAVVIRGLAIVALAIEAARLVRGASTSRGRMRAFLGTTGLHRLAMTSVLAFGASLLLSTALSVAPRMSWWGSYERRQGAYTAISYIVLFAIACARLERSRIERLVSVLCQSAVAMSLYALVQVSGHDPIPWTTDVVKRPTSTTGNSATLAGFLVVVTPFLWMRLADAWRSRSATSSVVTPVRRGRLFELLGTHLMLLGSVFVLGQSKGWFGEPLRYALAIAVAVLTWALRGAVDAAERRHFAAGVLAAAGAWTVLTMVGVLGGGSSVSGALVLTALAMATVAFWGHQRSTREASSERRSRDATSPWTRRGILVGHALAVVVCVLVVFLTQARGPQIALFVSLVAFWNVKTFLANERRSQSRRGLRRIVGLSVQALLILGLLIFNLSTSPLARSARELPYVGRLGKWLLLSEGTGRERLLIWRGDAYGSGMLGLVTESPFRSMVGHGPETLKESFARVFPPSLVAESSRDLSPDRAHQAMLDVWYGQGLLGLIALLGVFGAAIAMTIRGARVGDERGRALSTACLAAVMANIVDGIAEIPSTASLTAFWMVLAIAVAIPRTDSSDDPAPRLRAVHRVWGAVLLLATLAAVAGWSGNVSSVVADMHFHGGHRYAGDARLPSLVARCESTLRAMEAAPREDEYPADLGSVFVLMSRHQLGPHRRRDEPGGSRCARIFDSSDREGLLLEGRSALHVAYRLNERSKDRIANLAEIEALLYEATGNRAHLEASLRWYERASSAAPNDVRILNHRASALIAAGAEHSSTAEALLERSRRLDPGFIETRVVFADLLLAERRMEEAAAAYADVLRTSPGTLRTGDGSRFRDVVADLRAAGDFVRPLEAALEAYLREMRGQLVHLAGEEEKRWLMDEIDVTEQMLAHIRAGERD